MRKLDVVTFPSGKHLVEEQNSSQIFVSHKISKGLAFSIYLIFKRYRFTGKKNCHPASSRTYIKEECSDDVY